jgi:rRNA maturation endonuclease Nob1
MIDNKENNDGYPNTWRCETCGRRYPNNMKLCPRCHKYFEDEPSRKTGDKNINIERDDL